MYKNVCIKCVMINLKLLAFPSLQMLSCLCVGNLQTLFLSYFEMHENTSKVSGKMELKDNLFLVQKN